jgi:regulator of replication initiation timing
MASWGASANPKPEPDRLEQATDQAIAVCGDAREAVKSLIVANHFLETDLEKLRAAVSTGYARGKLFEAAKTLPRDRKNWYD